MNFSRTVCLIAMALGPMLPNGEAIAAPTVRGERDGLAAMLTVSSTEAVVEWRFLRPLSKPLTEVWATLNGRDLATPSYELFPGEGQHAAAIALLDIGDTTRADQIEAQKKNMLALALAKTERDLLGFAVYGLTTRLLAPESDQPEAIVDLLMALPPLSEKSNLSGALVHSVRMLERWPGERRAIYVFTDGHNDGFVDLQKVGDLAANSGVSLNFIVMTGPRATIISELERLTLVTGGQLVVDDQIKDFLKAPFALLHSGARVRFPLQGARRLFWEAGAEVKVALNDETATVVELTAPAEVLPASAGETAGYLVATYPVAAAASGSTVAALVLGLTAFGVMRRRAGKSVAAHERSPSAATAPAQTRLRVMLQDIADGSAYPVRALETRIGRDSGNDIVLHDKTVSRLHAVLCRQGDGYEIRNLSEVNGTCVNGKPADRVSMRNGDVIMFGNTALRFVQIVPEGNSGTRN